MITFVCDKPSCLTLINVINLFGTYSGLKINYEKTEVLPLGNKEVAVRNFELEGTKFKKTIKILGVLFTYNTSLFRKLNFESIEKSLKNLQKGWGWRGLTLIGKVQIKKSFALPEILYRLTLKSSEKEFIKKINGLLFSFVWKDKDKVQHTAFINPIEKGRLKMPNLNSMIATQRLMCIKRYLNSDTASWKYFLDFYLSLVGGKFLFHYNFNYSYTYIPP